MKISQQELKKIELLLDSSDNSNVELGLTILSGFVIDSIGVKWLFEYYQRLAKIEEEQSAYDLKSILIGTKESKPTKASRVLTVLLTKAPLQEKLKIYEFFINGNSLTLPRLEFTAFPTELYWFKNLEVINYQFGNLTVLTTDILRFEVLKSLDLRHQPLMTIEEEIVKHLTLKEIWIGNALILTEDLVDNAKFDILIEAAY